MYGSTGISETVQDGVIHLLQALPNVFFSYSECWAAVYKISTDVVRRAVPLR